MEKNACDMGNLFSDLEGLRIAIDMEARGRDFYKKAAAQTDNEEHKALFMLLMNEETTHYDQFTQLYNKIKEDKLFDSNDYLFDQETSKYLTVLAEPHIFPKDKVEIALPELKTVAKILRAAIQDEKDSILFYDALAKCAKFEETRKVFNLLKAEEQTHVVKLREILESL
ncbi:Rubrerythrin [Sporomusa ovata DSM 2662]|uniref:Rubrerythrin n=1 Tax=Sporomusa ovata TaxID=2378 RepID=A0A0U1L2Q8_9FIRM|nr:ferritin family protein [Sporomusa ovata]EQB25383.1 rubrerythrin [Sporomusa ovata DSM 2662]CQR73948.1 Rubrerythrin [Sporomusa ovata]